MVGSYPERMALDLLVRHLEVHLEESTVYLRLTVSDMEVLSDLLEVSGWV